MLISCPICMVCFDQSSSIYCLPCGHLYHVTCTLQWFERTATCPQCRKPTTEKKCIKVYPHVASLDSQSQSPSNLIETIDSMSLEIKNMKKAHNEIESVNASMSAELQNLKKSKETAETDLIRLESHNGLLRRQVKSLKNIENELKAMKTLKDKAESELAVFKNVNKVLNGSLSEAQEALLESAGATDVGSILTMCNSLKKELINAKAQKHHLKKTMDHEKARYKESHSKLEKHHKEEVAKLERHICELESELLTLQTGANKRSHQAVPSLSKFDDLGVDMLEPDECSQKSTASSLSTASSQSFTSCKSSASGISIVPGKNRVLKPSNTNKVKVPLQKSGIFGAARPGSSGINALNKRMLQSAANPPSGMAFDGMGRTVKADSGFKTTTAIKRFKF